MSPKKYAIGIDIGGTRTKLAIIDEAGEILISALFLTTDHPDKDDYFCILEKEIQQLITYAKDQKINLEGIGIGAPNAHREKGVMMNPPNFSWNQDLALVELLQKTILLPIVLENDACIAGFGEGQWGVAKELDRFVVVTLGTGVGICTFIDGHAVKSVDGLNGEFGHISLYPKGRECPCGGVGHLERYLSVSGIVQSVNESTGNDFVFKDILQEFQKEKVEPKLLAAIQQASDDLGRALSFIHLLLGPKLFVLAGGGSLLGDKFSKMVEEALQKYTFLHFKNHPEVKTSLLTTELGAVAGAAALIFMQS